MILITFNSVFLFISFSSYEIKSSAFKIVGLLKNDYNHVVKSFYEKKITNLSNDRLFLQPPETVMTASGPIFPLNHCTRR